jgi:hypothetical protein
MSSPARKSQFDNVHMNALSFDESPYGEIKK